MKLLSLFDGSGGFPLAASLCGIEPVMASEVEPYPIAVTKSRFPNIKHLGSVTDINGGNIEPVDIVTFGSPCFVAGTLVKTSTGLRLIEDLRVGDKVLTHKLRYREIVQTMSKKSKEIYRIKLLGGGTVSTTSEHPFWARKLVTKKLDETGFTSPEWVKAKDLKNQHYWLSMPTEMAHLFSKNQGPVVDGLMLFPIRSIEVVKEDCTVYNIGVDEDESYTANGICCHNCQDLSLAGARKGLKHEDKGDEETTRSGLFMEAIRIIKEMREATDGLYPRFAVWENVPGAFSSNKGQDFRTVLGEFVKINEASAVMPDVPTAGWNYWDCFSGDGWSLAYRTFDAQYWGVPQRRRRIYLVCDFTGQSAKKILFERNGLPRYIAKSRTERENFASPFAKSIKPTDKPLICFEPGATSRLGGYWWNNLAPTLRAEPGDNLPAVCKTELYSVDQGGGKSSANILNNPSPTLTCTHGGEPVIAKKVTGFDGYNGDIAGDTSNTLGVNCGISTGRNGVICMATQQGGAEVRTDNKAPTLTAAAGMSGNNQPVICLQGNDIDRADTAGCNGKGWKEDVAYTLNTVDRHAVAYNGESITNKQNASNPKDGDPCHTLGATGASRTLICYSVENHPADSRVNIDETGKVQTLTSRMGSGGGNVPLVMTKSSYPAYSMGTGCFAIPRKEQANPLMARDYKQGPYVFIPTKEAVCIGNGQADGLAPSNQCRTLSCMHDQQIIIAIDRETFNCGQRFNRNLGISLNGVNSTLNAQGPGAVAMQEEENYVVRRLTPTECARLQGFPDNWGEIDHKEDFTDDEYEFWLNVRNTHATINGKTVREYTKKSMLTWYNKLHSDGAEYKMWGNGIALPNALYVMRGIELEAKEVPNEG